MQKINCDECKKEGCPKRIKGALCFFNSQLQDLIVVCETRDPKMMARHLASIMGSEMERYEKAKSVECIGEEIEFTYVNKKGDDVTVRKIASVNPAVTQLAHSLVKSGKIINDILNPPKVAPMFQQNNQYNFGTKVANAVGALGENERVEAIKYIDDKLNAVK
jgi:hypothetical protein